MSARTDTPDRTRLNEEGRKVTTMRVKRACNGCGELLGDLDDRDVDEHGNLTDVRSECSNCRPLVELEASGRRTWQVTPRNYGRLLDHEIDQYGVFAKHYTEAGPDGRLVAVGIRVGERPNHIVARFGDWVIRHPNGAWTLHKAPTSETA
ncbi:hypothetical protein ACWDVX_22725 [Streptomyces tendae]